MQADTSKLAGVGAAVTVTVLNKATPAVRAMATVYTRNPGAVVGLPEAFWTEQAVMMPHAHQQVRQAGIVAAEVACATQA